MGGGKGWHNTQWRLLASQLPILLMILIMVMWVVVTIVVVVVVWVMVYVLPSWHWWSGISLSLPTSFLFSFSPTTSLITFTVQPKGRDDYGQFQHKFLQIVLVELKHEQNHSTLEHEF